MKPIFINADVVIAINKLVCEEGKNPFTCVSRGKIDSAIHSAFYPGAHPYIHGNIQNISGALAYYLCQTHAFIDDNKRTAALSAIVLLNANGYELLYQCDDTADGLSNLILGIANSTTSLDQNKDWFIKHSHLIDK